MGDGISVEQQITMPCAEGERSGGQQDRHRRDQLDFFPYCGNASRSGRARACFLFGIEVRKLLEPRKSLIDLFASQSLHSLRAETFHGKGTHHAPIKHSSLELSRSDLRLRRQVAEKSARKRVARARWIDHFSQRQCWSAEESVVNAAGKRVF